MPTMTTATSYGHVHSLLKRVFGRAATHVCRCGRQALDWAYLRNDPNERVDSRGRPYSVTPSLDFYAALCRSCHLKLDRDLREEGYRATGEKFRSDPERLERQRKAGKRVGALRTKRLAEDPEFLAREQQRARDLGRAVAARRDADPVFDQYMRNALRRGGQVHAARMKTDPEYAARTLETLRENGKTAGAKSSGRKRSCDECGMVSHPVGIGRHQKASGHAGWRDLK